MDELTMLGSLTDALTGDLGFWVMALGGLVMVALPLALIGALATAILRQSRIWKSVAICTAAIGLILTLAFLWTAREETKIPMVSKSLIEMRQEASREIP